MQQSSVCVSVCYTQILSNVCLCAWIKVLVVVVNVHATQMFRAWLYRQQLIQNSKNIKEFIAGYKVFLYLDQDLSGGCW